MRILLIILVIALLSAASRSGAATVCAPEAVLEPPSGPDWVVDHYVRSSSGDREWAVMVDCNHPSAPERIRPVANREVGNRPTHPAGKTEIEPGPSAQPPAVPPPVVIRYGSPVVVVNAPNAAMTMRLSGVADSTAPVGQMIRVRLAVFHALVNGIVRDAGTVELVGAIESRWGRP